MKRLALRLATSMVALAAAFLAIAARPARAYADTGARTPCSDAEIAACDGKASGDICTTASGTGVCQQTSCEDDASALVPVVACWVSATDEAGAYAPLDGSAASSASPDASLPPNDLTGCVSSSDSAGSAVPGALLLATLALLWSRRRLFEPR
jgi:MYXO-CTERM domain-containing protein